jgi:hypothetical protein
MHKYINRFLLLSILLICFLSISSISCKKATKSKEELVSELTSKLDNLNTAAEKNTSDLYEQQWDPASFEKLKKLNAKHGQTFGKTYYSSPLHKMSDYNFLDIKEKGDWLRMEFVSKPGVEFNGEKLLLTVFHRVNDDWKLYSLTSIPQDKTKTVDELMINNSSTLESFIPPITELTPDKYTKRSMEDMRKYYNDLDLTGNFVEVMGTMQHLQDFWYLGEKSDSRPVGLIFEPFVPDPEAITNQCDSPCKVLVRGMVQTYKQLTNTGPNNIVVTHIELAK